MERRCARVDRDHIVAALVRSKAILEACHLGAVPSHAARMLSTTSSISASSIWGAPKTRKSSLSRTGAAGLERVLDAVMCMMGIGALYRCRALGSPAVR